MGNPAAYDRIADWYEREFLTRSTGDPPGVHRTLRELLGHGDGVCLEVGCVTGTHAGRIRCGGFADRTDPATRAGKPH